MAGLLFFVLIAWSSSENRKQVRLSTIAGGLGLQFVLAFTLLKIPLFKTLFGWLNGIVIALSDATGEGTRFVFGYLGGAD